MEGTKLYLFFIWSVLIAGLISFGILCIGSALRGDFARPEVPTPRKSVEAEESNERLADRR